VALILEVVDARSGEVRTRVRLDTLPLTLGRALDNDLVLDDPYVDARHARIVADDTGALVIQDLGSINGLVATGSTERRPNIAVRHGEELRAGRTILRFRDSERPLPPALRYEVGAVRADGAAPWWSTTWARIASPVAAIAAFGLFFWLGTYERAGGADAMGFSVAFLLGAAVWAGIWAVASRVTVHRFHFPGHLAVVCAAALAVLLIAAAGEWIAFLFPDNNVAGLIEGLIALVVTAALVAGHLALASTLSRAQRWRAGISTSVVLAVLAGVVSLADTEVFSDVPEFAGVLKPLPARMLPAGTVESFARVGQDLKEQVDELASKE
jgi:hypothetical protein